MVGTLEPDARRYTQSWGQVMPSALASFKNLDQYEREYLDAKRGIMPDDTLAENLRQYRAIKIADTQAAQAEGEAMYDTPASPDRAPVADGPAPTQRPGLDEFLAEVGPKNSHLSTKDLTQYWNANYGHVDPATLPTFETFLPEVKAHNPDLSDADLKTYWEDRYGALGAREQKPGFWESAGQGLKQGVQQLGSAAAGTFERLQKPEDQWHKIGSDVADTFDKEAAKFAPPAELAQQPWYQRMRDPEYLGNLFGNVAVQSAPSLGGAIVGGVVGGPAGAAAGITAVTYFQQAGGTYREAFERYKKEGLDENAAHEKAYQDSGIAGLVSGVVNALAIPASLVAPFASTLKNLALQYTLNVAVDTGDQATQNVVAKATYNPEQELSQGIPEAIVGSMGLSAPETMGAVKTFTGGGGASVRLPSTAGPTPAPITHPPLPKDVGVFDENVGLDEAVSRAKAIVETPVGSASGETVTAPGLTDRDAVRLRQQIEAGGRAAPVGSAAGPDLGGPTDPANQLAQQIERGGALPDQAQLIQAAERTRTPFEVPVLSGPAVTEQPAIQPGQAFTPRAEPQPDPRAAIEAERNRLIAQREQTIVPHGTIGVPSGQTAINEPPAMEPQRTQPIIPPVPSLEVAKQEVAPSKPIPTAVEKTLPTVQDIHVLAASKGLDINTPVFHEYSKMTVGESKLDNMSPYELKQLADKLQKVSEKAPSQPVATPTPKTEPLALPSGQTATEPLPTFEAAQVPRSQLVPEQNAEMLARAEKAQADLEIAGTERGGRYFHETQGKGSEQDVTGLKSATAPWYKEATSGQQALSRQRVEVAVQKIIGNKGRDVGKDVQRIKELLLLDREFMRSPFAPKSKEDWHALIAEATHTPPLQHTPQAEQPSAGLPSKVAQTTQPGSEAAPLSKVQAEKAKLQQKPKAEQPSENYRILPAKTRTSFEASYTGAGAQDRPSVRTLKEWLAPNNKTLRTEFERRSGVRLPKGLAAANAAVEEYFKQNHETISPRETIDVSNDTPRGENAAGEKLYERADGTRYRMRTDRKDRPYGYPDFGGDLSPVEKTQHQDKAAPFSLTSQTVAKPQAAKPEQTSIEVPPPTVGEKPIIGREAQPEEAPLFSKAEKEAQPEQAVLPEGQDYTSIPAGILVNIKGIRISTGEKITVKGDARETVKDLDASRAKYQQLLECLQT